MQNHPRAVGRPPGHFETGRGPVRPLEVEPLDGASREFDKHGDVGAHHWGRGRFDYESKESFSAGRPPHSKVVRRRTDFGFVVGCAH